MSCRLLFILDFKMKDKKNNQDFGPIKSFIFLIAVFLIVSFCCAKKISYWEQASAKNYFSEFSMDYLDFIKSKTEQKNQDLIKIPNTGEIETEYESQIGQIIDPLEKKGFVEDKIKPPYKALIIGDSFIVGSFGSEMEREFLRYKDFEVVRFGKSSTGLSRPDYFDWNSQITDLIAKNKPNVAIVMFGANDGQNIPMQDGKGLVYGTQAWDEEYGKRVYKFLKILKDNNIFVVWVGNPIAREDSYSEKMSRLNRIFEKESFKFLNCKYISTWEMLADGNGLYTDYLPDLNGQQRLVRASDGIHVSAIGGKMIAQKVIFELSQFFEMNLK